MLINNHIHDISSIYPKIFLLLSFLQFIKLSFQLVFSDFQTLFRSMFQSIFCQM